MLIRSGDEHPAAAPGPDRGATPAAVRLQEVAAQRGLPIHIPADDFARRKVGYRCGKDALALAGRYRSARP